MSDSTLRLSIHQFAPALCAVDANAARIADAASEAGTGLLLTPELSLTGYELGDDAVAVACDPDAPLPRPLQRVEDIQVVVGRVERDGAARVYNAAVVARAGVPLFRHRKVYLPTYGMFDEARFFARGHTIRRWTNEAGWRVGVLVCEDFWHPALAYLLAAGGADLILVQAAAPGRGVWEGGEAGGRFASWDSWERIARTTAQLHGVHSRAREPDRRRGRRHVRRRLSHRGPIRGRDRSRPGRCRSADLGRAEDRGGPAGEAPVRPRQGRGSPPDERRARAADRGWERVSGSNEESSRRGDGPREARIAAVVGGVLRQALTDAGASRLVLVDADSPEGGLLRGWAADALGDECLIVVGDQEPGGPLVAALARAATNAGEPAPEAVARVEARRAVARILAAYRSGLCADASNKTALLLADDIPPEPLLPLGDLYASQVRQLCGAWNGPAPVRRLADQSGGIELLDRALIRWIDGRESPDRALEGLPDAARREVVERVRAGRSGRRRAGLVPKLGPRTIGIDLLW